MNMAEGIVIQLQKEALDDKVEIESLLRKAYLVARKLDLKDFEAWIIQEQNGYKSDIPEYRIISGLMKAWNPYYGWTQIIVQGEVSDYLSHMRLQMSIPSICEAYRNSINGSVSFAISGELTEVLNKFTDGFQTNFSFFSTSSELHRIISAVRNNILEWSLLLEENGITGKGLSFSDEEVQKANNSSTINQYINNFFSTAERIQISQDNI